MAGTLPKPHAHSARKRIDLVAMGMAVTKPVGIGPSCCQPCGQVARPCLWALAHPLVRAVDTPANERTCRVCLRGASRSNRATAKKHTISTLKTMLGPAWRLMAGAQRKSRGARHKVVIVSIGGILLRLESFRLDRTASLVSTCELYRVGNVIQKASVPAARLP